MNGASPLRLLHTRIEQTTARPRRAYGVAGAVTSAGTIRVDHVHLDELIEALKDVRRARL